MKYLSNYKLFENSPQFPTETREIEEICQKYIIRDYSIRPDRKVDVFGTVHIGEKNLKDLPLQFGLVTGDFWCDQNLLTSLEGAPIEVGGGFYCHKNDLTSLQGAPQKVGNIFDCATNKLTDLKGAPKEVIGKIYCHNNQIYEMGLENGEFYWEDLFYCFENPINRIIALFFESIPGADSKTELLNSQKRFFQSLDYHYFKGGNKIDRRKFHQACEEFDMPKYSILDGYEFV